MLDAFGEAAQSLFTLNGLVAVAAGTLIGSLVAILPGIGIVMTLALLLPLTIGMGTTEALMFLVAIIGAAGFGGSITSILFNVPGDGINAATCLDGYPMARQGKAGTAIGASAAASGLGALIGVGLLVLSIPFIRGLILLFGPAEFFALTVAGLAMIAAVSQRAPLKSAAAALTGMTIGLVGESLVTATPRFTFGLLELADGVPLVPALIGLFAIPEIFDLLQRSQATISRVPEAAGGSVWRGALEVLRRPGLLLRSSLIGTGIGIVPGVGASVASWVAYFSAMNRSKERETFGKGNIEGVIAPEAAIDAKEGGAMLPVLAFGVPGSLTTAILLSAFLIHGVQPGQRLFQNDLPLVFAMILALVITNVSTSLLGLLLGGQLLKVTLIPVVILAPFILVLGFVGAFGDQQSMLGIAWALAFGVLGIALRRYGYPIPPLIVGFIMLPLVEEYFRLAVATNRGSLTFLLDPVPATVLVVTALALAVPRLLGIVRRRRSVVPPGADQVPEEAAASPGLGRVATPALLLAGVGIGLLEMFVLRPDEYSERAMTFPLLVMPLLATLLVIVTAKELVLLLAKRGEAQSPATATRPAWQLFLVFGALPVAMYVAGIAAGSGLYVAGFLVVSLRSRGLVPRLIAASAAGAATALAIWYVYGTLLGMRLQ